MSESPSVVSDSLRPHGLYSPQNSPGQNTGVGSLSLLQENLPNPGIKSSSPTLQVDSFPAEPQRKPGRGDICILWLIYIVVWQKPTQHCKAISSSKEYIKKKKKKRDLSSSELPRWLRWSRICLQCRRPRFHPGLERSLGEGNGNPLQYSCLENSMD